MADAAICSIHADDQYFPPEKEIFMKKAWAKPTMCQVAAGMEISRYLPAQVATKR